MRQDLIHALRLFRRAPAFTLASLLTLALGIGAMTAIYSIVDGAVLRPLPYDEPDRLVTIQLTNPTTGDRTVGMMPRGFLDWREHADVFEALSLAAGGLFTVRGAGEPEEVRVIRASAGFFEVLRTTPLLGRTFVEADERIDRSHVAIISHGYWRDRFASAPDVVGRTLRLEDDPYVIVGVLPADFEWPVAEPLQTGIFLPLAFSPEDRQYGVPQSYTYQVTARLREDVTTAQAEQSLDAIQARFEEARVKANRGFTRVTLVPMIEMFVSGARQWMLTLLGAVALVLLIACVNVSNLFLAQGATRARELTLRGALGAGCVAGRQLRSSLLLSTAGAAAGVAIAWWGVGMARVALPISVPRSNQRRSIFACWHSPRSPPWLRACCAGCCRPSRRPQRPGAGTTRRNARRDRRPSWPQAPGRTGVARSHAGRHAARRLGSLISSFVRRLLLADEDSIRQESRRCGLRRPAMRRNGSPASLRPDRARRPAPASARRGRRDHRRALRVWQHVVSGPIPWRSGAGARHRADANHPSRRDAWIPRAAPGAGQVGPHDRRPRTRPVRPGRGHQLEAAARQFLPAVDPIGQPIEFTRSGRSPSWASSATCATTARGSPTRQWFSCRRRRRAATRARSSCALRRGPRPRCSQPSDRSIRDDPSAMCGLPAMRSAGARRRRDSTCC
ncbi:MAG: ABC transporter permease [Vicinamibacterales bacterium]